MKLEKVSAAVDTLRHNDQSKHSVRASLNLFLFVEMLPPIIMPINAAHTTNPATMHLCLQAQSEIKYSQMVK